MKLTDLNPETATLEDFYEFFAAIPEDKWCVIRFEHNGRHCARGHLGTRDRLMPAPLEQRLKFLLISGGSGLSELVEANNGIMWPYGEIANNGAKHRVLKFLANLCETKNAAANQTNVTENPASESQPCSSKRSDREVTTAASVLAPYERPLAAPHVETVGS